MAASLRLRIVNAEKVIAALSGHEEAAKAAQKAAMSDSVQLVHRRVSFNLTGGNPLHVRTGRLRQSLQTFVSVDGTSGTVGTNVEYARIHEFGGTIPAHEIRPHGGALQFRTPGFIGPIQTTKKGGISKRATSGVTYASVVHHPGATIQPRPYMRPALEDSRTDIMKIYVSRLSQALRGGRA